MITLNRIEMVYPPSPENERMAERLKKELSAYRIPSAVKKRTGINKLEEVSEPALIVFCMPESIGDPEVEEAIERFAEAGLSASAFRRVCFMRRCRTARSWTASRWRRISPRLRDA